MITIELIATVTAFMVILVELIKAISNIFGGSPEMRAIRSQLDANNKNNRDILLRISARVNAIGQKLGV